MQTDVKFYWLVKDDIGLQNHIVTKRHSLANVNWHQTVPLTGQKSGNCTRITTYDLTLGSFFPSFPNQTKHTYDPKPMKEYDLLFCWSYIYYIFIWTKNVFIKIKSIYTGREQLICSFAESQRA